MKTLTMQRMLNIYGSTATRSAVVAAEECGGIPQPSRKQTGTLSRRFWEVEQLPKVGERFGFLRAPKKPICVAVYSAKGGVFKTSLALNLARMSALHNIKTCILGLDFQCDITRILGDDAEENLNLQDAISKIWKRKGLLELLAGTSLKKVLSNTDLPTLQYVAETAGLVTLERTIGAQDRREFRLKEFIKDKLEPLYDLIIIDCPPSWSHLITNALVACDVLLSPLECKISQFNSLPVFMDHLTAFRETMGLKYDHLYIPSRFAANKRLSSDIRNWYSTNLDRVSAGVIRESAIGEEAIGSKLSIPEYAPTSLYAGEIRELIQEIWSMFEAESEAKKKAAS